VIFNRKKKFGIIIENLGVVKMREMKFHDDGTQSPFWSRDHHLENISCGIKKCPANKNGKCIMPSCIKIGEDGVCNIGKGYIKKNNE
jgi:hypothetical protein